MKTIVILSGGLDSTVLLYNAIRNSEHVRALSIDYGQRHRIELERAKQICELNNIEHRIADLSGIKPLLAGSSQTSDTPVPHGHYAAESMKLTVVPNRNMILIAVAAAWAISTKSDVIEYGAHAGDHAIYPDCRPEFADGMAELVQKADWHPVMLARPFIEMNKADIVKRGAALNVPFALTYSCYEGKPVHCGKCGTCVERREAFQLAGVKDPTEYQD